MSERREAKRAIDKRRRRARARQIDEYARRILDAFVVEGHLAVELDRDPHRVGQDRAADVANGRQRSAAGGRGSLCALLCRLHRSAGGVDDVHARELRRHLRSESARGVAVRETPQQLDAGVTIDGLPEPRESVEREAASLP